VLEKLARMLTLVHSLVSWSVSLFWQPNHWYTVYSNRPAICFDWKPRTSRAKVPLRIRSV